jgi:photosystem II stability/assembly factor-like uncharacterized protein
MRARFFAAGATAFLALSCSGDGGEKKTPPPTTTSKTPTQGWKAAVGDGGTLLETFDDASWDVRQVTSHDLYAVSCADNELGWAVGANGFIGHTRDGGWSWPAQASGVTTSLLAVSFAFAVDGAVVGLAAGEGGTLLTTQDGGDHWQAVRLDGAPTLRGTAIAEGAGLLLAVGDGGFVARSTDQGKHFDSYIIADAGDLFDVALDASGGVALTVDGDGGIWQSRDAAKSFSLEERAAGPLESVSLGKSSALASAAGPDLALLRTVNEGWHGLRLNEADGWHATLVGPHEDRAYFAGDDGALLETSDQGESVHRVAAATHAALRAIEDLEPR